MDDSSASTEQQMSQESIRTREQYAGARERLLDSIIHGLRDDPRIVAAWLGGSYGRGEEDDFSDIDIHVVTSDEAGQGVLTYSRTTSSGCPEERLALFTPYGDPMNVHENHQNAPEGGTFSAVFYRDPPVIVDWTIIPTVSASRPVDTKLLFERSTIPVVDNPTVDEMKKNEQAEWLRERLAFFWMMAAVTAKYIQRGRAFPANQMIHFATSIVFELSNLTGYPLVEDKGGVYPGRKEQSSRLLELCEHVRQMGLDCTPLFGIETILNLS